MGRYAVVALVIAKSQGKVSIDGIVAMVLQN